MNDPWQTSPLLTVGESLTQTLRDAQVIEVPSTSEVSNSGGRSAASISVTNLVGADVEIKFGTNQTPNAVDASLGKYIVPEGATILIQQPGEVIGLASVQALSAPTGANPRVVVNYENSFTAS